MRDALMAYLTSAARGADHTASVLAGAEAVAADPWAVVHNAGRLARAARVVAPQDLGLSARLGVVKPTSRSALVRVDAGQPFPTNDVRGRRGRGAFDTPAEMAREVVRRTMDATFGPVRAGLDPACGTGAFLLAMQEAGVPEIYGTDLDPVALEVARIAVPSARVHIDDALRYGPTVDLVCGNPPYVPPERQDRGLRDDLRRRFPWLGGRFDLAIPFAATAVERARPGGGIGLVLPYAALVQPYGATLRRRWMERHRVAFLTGPLPFPGVSVEVGLVVLASGEGPAPLPDGGMSAEELLRLDGVPLSAMLLPGDVHLVEAMRSRAAPLGTLAKIDTGLVAHGPDGGKARLLSDSPGEGRVPYADAKGFFTGRIQWLDYRPERMHRAKSPELFEADKIVIQRIRGRGTVRAAIDRMNTYVGHTCTVVVPHDPRLELGPLLDLVRSPLVDGLTRIERGERLDLYPHDVAAMPVPVDWLKDPELPLQEAFGLSDAQTARLMHVAARRDGAPG